LNFSAMPTAPSNVGYREYTGRHLLIARFSHFVPLLLRPDNIRLLALRTTLPR
jgi:hypothetical protein